MIFYVGTHFWEGKYGTKYKMLVRKRKGKTQVPRGDGTESSSGGATVDGRAQSLSAGKDKKDVWCGFADMEQSNG